LTDKPRPDATTTRRARRTAERRAAATSTGRAVTRKTLGRSPILLITAIVGGLGIVALGALILLQGGSAPKVDASGLTAPASPTPTALADGRSLGKPDASVTLGLWSDFQCPICGQFARTVEPALVSKYVTAGTLRIVHHDAAFQGAKAQADYDESVEAGAGARCAAAQHLYWPFQDWAFANQAGENQGAFASDRLQQIAVAAGVDLHAWQACMATGQQETAVRAETAQAVANGVNATPTMTLNGQTLVGFRSVAQLSGLIDAAAAKASAVTEPTSSTPP
jgi:protein-disulfide isomerase